MMGRARFASLLLAVLGVGSFLRAEESGTTLDSEIRRASREAPLSLQFQGNLSAEFADWQKKFSGRLKALLGPTDPPPAWTTAGAAPVELPECWRWEYRLEAKGFPALPLYLLVPKGMKPGEKRPAVLCVHGHGLFGSDPVVGRTDLPGVIAAIGAANYDYGLAFVKRGYVVAAPCLIPLGQRSEAGKDPASDPCAVALVRLQALGRLPISENLRDLRWSLSFLQSRAEVDGDLLGCAGLSYGGRMTMLVTAVDDRIRVAAVSGALNLLQERILGAYSCGSQIIPGLLQIGDFSDIGCLIAPRPCVWEIGSEDQLIRQPWDGMFRGSLERAYLASGHPESLRFDQFQGGHQWHGTVAYQVFDAILRPPTDPAP